MPANYNGDETGIALADPVTLTVPIDADARNAESVNVAFRALANLIRFIKVKAAFLAQANTFTAANTFNGAAADVNPALRTTFVPVAYKLLWEIAGAAGGYSSRLYAGTSGLFIVQGATWDGANWVRDNATSAPSRLVIQSPGLIKTDWMPAGAAGSTFADGTWGSFGGTGGSASIQAHVTAGSNIGIEPATGRITAPGAIDVVAATAIKASAAADVLLTGVTYPKRFPLVPSSLTLTPLQAAVNCGARSVTNSNQWGCTVTATATAAGIASFAEKLTAS